MPWHPDCPRDPKPYGSGSIAPHRVVWHRTIGSWPGDYSVLSRSKVPSVHFLVGQDRGEWVQFYDTGTKCAHAAGANDAVGIELSGQNGEPLTDWQIEAGGSIARWLIGMGIEATFLDSGPRVGDWSGFGNHSNVATTPSMTHYDYIERAEFDRMIGAAPQPQAKKKDDEMRARLVRNPETGAVYTLTAMGKVHLTSPLAVQSVQQFAPYWLIADDATIYDTDPALLAVFPTITDATSLFGRLVAWIGRLFPGKAARAGEA